MTPGSLLRAAADVLDMTPENRSEADTRCLQKGHAAIAGATAERDNTGNITGFRTRVGGAARGPAMYFQKVTSGRNDVCRRQLKRRGCEFMQAVDNVSGPQNRATALSSLGSIDRDAFVSAAESLGFKEFEVLTPLETAELMQRTGMTYNAMREFRSYMQRIRGGSIIASAKCVRDHETSTLGEVCAILESDFTLAFVSSSWTRKGK